MKTTNKSVLHVLTATCAMMVASVPIAAVATPTNVYWTARNAATLHKTDVASGTTTQLVASTGGRLQDVDLDANTNTLYFSDWGNFGGSSGAIHRIQTDGSGQGLVLGGGVIGDAVHQLHLDTANNRIYFTRAVSYDNREISRVDTSGANYTQLRTGTGFSGTDGWFYSGLAVDVANDAIYWGDIGVLTPAPPADGALNTMTLAGVAPTTLVPHVDGKGRGMVLDQAAQTLFYTSHNRSNPDLGGSVFSYDIGSGVETQLPISNPNNYGFWDIEIDPTMNRIWWTVNNGGAGAGEIWSANFDGTGLQTELTGLTDVYGLALEIPEPTIPALVDIRPGDFPNSVNLKSKGVLPVAILGTNEFDVTEVDIATLLFGDPNGGPAVSPVRSALEDVSGDGFLDLSLKFSMVDLVGNGALNPDTIEGILIGLLVDGTTSIEGMDSIRIVPSNGSKGNSLQVSAVPEPTTSALALAVLCLVMSRRRAF